MAMLPAAICWVAQQAATSPRLVTTDRTADVADFDHRDDLVVPHVDLADIQVDLADPQR